MICIFMIINQKIEMGNQTNGCFKSSIIFSGQTKGMKNKNNGTQYKYQRQGYLKKKSPNNRFKTSNLIIKGGNQVKIPRTIRVSIRNSLKYQHPDAIKQVSERLQHSIYNQNVFIQNANPSVGSIVLSKQGQGEGYQNEMLPTRGSLTSDQLLPSVVIKQINYDAKIQYQKQLIINHERR